MPPGRCAPHLSTKGYKLSTPYLAIIAVWSIHCGFAPSAGEATEEVTFKRSNAHQHVAAECRAVRESVGLLEISNYGKFEITGPGAVEWLGRIMANRVPAVGRMALTPMLNERGKLIGDFTVCRPGAAKLFLIGTYAAETYYMRWFERHLPLSGVTLRPCALEYVGLALTGPRARALYDLLVAAGREQGLKSFGGRALNALRIEKSFGSWTREYRPIYGLYEAGLGRFVDLKKGDFIGRAAAIEEHESGGALRLVAFAMDAAAADAIGDEPIWHDNKVVGWVTSGAYGHSVQRSLALGYIPADLAGDSGADVLRPPREAAGHWPREGARAHESDCLEYR